MLHSVRLLLCSGATSLFPPDSRHGLIGWIFFHVLCDRTDWLPCDYMVTLHASPVSSAQLDGDLTGRLVCVVAYSFPETIDPRQSSTRWSVCGRFSVALYTTAGMCIAGHAMIRQQVSEGIFICEQPVSVNILLAVNCIRKNPWLPLLLCHPRRQLLVFFFLSCPPLIQFFSPPFYLSRHQFNVSISFVPVSLSCSVSCYILSVCVSVSRPLPPSWCSCWHLRRPVCARQPFLRLRYPGF